ncbi:MAG: 1,6-anhydro-N-acetylmuramyl-L-alanine amidase AmpD [Gammaproteobacteria bacterium]|nr:1,6-anhydro-N-acetylmuramyl-L-alanine amidase AmpD [Gammaproteobacteria bacterium]
MKINTKTGLIENAQYTASANTDERPVDTDIDLLVIHSISLPPGEYGGPWIEKLFTNALPADEHPYFKEIHELKVSSHVLIRRDGTVQQFVPFHQRAWHAGQSCYEGRETCNDFSIGIELEGTDDSAFENIQYQQLAELIDALTRSYPNIDKNRLTGHSDIAPGRKTDPGTGFDWDKLRQLLT